MTDWRAFLGLSVAAVLLFLFLARATQGLLSDGESSEPEDTRRPGTDPGGASADAGASGASTDPDRPSTALGDVESAPVERSSSEADPARPARHPRTGPASRPRRTELTPEDLGPGALLANVLLTHGVLAGAVAAGAVLWRVPAGALGVAAPTPVAVGTGVAAGVVLYLLNELATTGAELLGADADEGLRELLAPDTRRGWVILLLGVLPTVAVAEEVLFRAALVGAAAAGFGLSPWLLAAASSVAFGLGHGAQGRAGVAVTGLLGFALAATFVVTGSLLVVVVAHYVVNALEFLVHEWLGVEF